MASADTPMICPNCKVAMNHHADKVVFPTDARDAGSIDPTSGGMVEEFHTCPKCGDTASRPA
jgi:ribosomal protein S27AE